MLPLCHGSLDGHAGLRTVPSPTYRLIHVNSPTFSERLPLSAAIFSKIFLKIRGIFTNSRNLPPFYVRNFFFA
jgi:hypothetical protein